MSTVSIAIGCILCGAVIAASPPAASTRQPGALPLAASVQPAAGPARPTSSPFPSIDGWKLTEGPTAYDGDTLFQYIDGAAPEFLSADFVELLSATYANRRGVEVTVDLYRHQTPFRAFGMYTQERPAGTTPIPVGIEGHGGKDYLQFVVGPYYVKMQKRGAEEVPLRFLAEKVAARLLGTREAPLILKAFPARGKLPRAERMTAHDFLGYSYFHDAVAVPYEIEGAHFRLFAIRARDEAEVRDMLKRYLSATQSPAAEVKSAGNATVKDPLNGAVDLRWQGPWVWGAVDQASPMRKPLLDELGRNLPSADP